MCEPFLFPLDNFLAEFPEFGNNTSFTNTQIARVGGQAQKYITEGRSGFPLICPDDRLYALFLMTAHILTLRKNAADELSSGNIPTGGRVRKATVGAVTVETDSPTQLDNITYWLSQTIYGQELLSYLDISAPAGLYLNTRRDSVRIL